MRVERKDIVSQLQKDILSLQEFNRLPAEANLPFELGPVEAAFPNHCFPIAAVHEFICHETEYAAVSAAFIACLTATLMRNSGASVWISNSQTIFPPALKTFGIEPDKIIFIDGLNQKNMLWVMEEALKCEGLAAVIGEIKEIDFTASRRLQLAVEKSRVTGFIIRNHPRTINITACVSRWKITSMPSEPEQGLPGISFPRWNVELLKIRNGQPGTWQMEWAAGRFHFISPLVSLLPEEQKRKTG